MGVERVCGAGVDTQVTAPQVHARGGDDVPVQIGAAVFQGSPALRGGVPLDMVGGEERGHGSAAHGAVDGARVGEVPGGEAADLPARGEGQVAGVLGGEVRFRFLLVLFEALLLPRRDGFLQILGEQAEVFMFDDLLGVEVAGPGNALG